MHYCLRLRLTGDNHTAYYAATNDRTAVEDGKRHAAAVLRSIRPELRPIAAHCMISSVELGAINEDGECGTQVLSVLFDEWLHTQACV